MRKRYFGWEQAFHYLWNNADDDGIWHGDAATLAQDFCVSENEAHSGLNELCERRLIERIDQRAYAMTNWPEEDESHYPAVGSPSGVRPS